jgi:PAS domain S-box-containing protein
MYDATENAKRIIDTEITGERQETASYADDELRRESDAILHSFYDSAPMMMGVVDILDNDILHLSDNAATARFMGVTPGTTPGRLASELGMPRQSIEEWLRHYRECARTQTPVRFKYAHHTPQGVRWLSVTVSYIAATAEGIFRCSYIGEDVTEQKRSVDLLRQQSEALTVSQRWLRSLIDHFPNGAVVLFDQDLRFVIAGGQGLTEAGMTPDSLEGKTVWEAFHPDIAAINDPMMRAALAGRASATEVDYAGRTYEVSARPIHNEEGEVVAGMTITYDISDRNKHLLEIETLNARLRRSVQETHHRVKNNLQVISALAELQMETGDTMVPAAALQRIGQHTRSLAALHDLLTQEAKGNVEADSISTCAALDKLIPLLQSMAGDRCIRYQAEDFRLPVREGASLALLVSELISNAVKHGRADIELTLTVNGGMARLEVCDDGPGFPPDFDWHKAANTGLGLIDSTGRHDLQGSISYENRPAGGARVVVTFPLPGPTAGTTTDEMK